MRQLRQVNRVLYIILALLLGSFGLHKFYAGKPLAGILYLLFCWSWIPTILTIFDIIVALCKDSDGQGNIWL